MTKSLLKLLILIFLLLSCDLCTDNESSIIPPETEPSVITFITEGSSFSPVITVSGTPIIKWSWADGTTSDSITPTKDYGSEVTRKNTLEVTPWSALERINIGYDGSDGGTEWENRTGFSADDVEDQSVSSVLGLEAVADYLKKWFSSYNLIESIDFTDFINLDTIECYNSSQLQEIILANTPSLQRLCIENCIVESLDLSHNPALEDLRGAMNNYPTIDFGNIGTETWHICVNTNNFTDTTIFEDMSQFPNIEDLFIWNSNQNGSLIIPSTGTGNSINIQVRNNNYTTIDLRGSLQYDSYWGVVSLYSNKINQVLIDGCSQIMYFDAHDNSLSESEIDYILNEFDNLNRSEGPDDDNIYIDLSGNDPPSAAGLVSKNNLIAKGWEVRTD